MHLFQQWVPKDYEVRLTMVDDQFFAARIDARTAAAKVDWRADYHALDYTAIDTPKFVRTRVTELLRRLGLRFAAMDFVVAPDGEWWFLDCNPNASGRGSRPRRRCPSPLPWPTPCKDGPRCDRRPGNASRRFPGQGRSRPRRSAGVARCPA